MTIRADKREVTKAASVLAKASWMRNAEQKAMVENKKKQGRFGTHSVRCGFSWMKGRMSVFSAGEDQTSCWATLLQ